MYYWILTKVRGFELDLSQFPLFHTRNTFFFAIHWYQSKNTDKNDFFFPSNLRKFLLLEIDKDKSVFPSLRIIFVLNPLIDERHRLRTSGPATNTISSLVMLFRNPILKDAVIARRMRSRNESNLCRSPLPPPPSENSSRSQTEMVWRQRSRIDRPVAEKWPKCALRTPDVLNVTSLTSSCHVVAGWTRSLNLYHPLDVTWTWVVCTLPANCYDSRIVDSGATEKR